MKKIIRTFIVSISVLLGVNTTFSYFTTSDNIESIFLTDSYTIRLNANGGTFLEDTLYILNGGVTLPKPIKDGSVFKGYSTTENGSIAYTDFVSDINDINDTLLYTNWEYNSYTITYDLDGGSVSGLKTSYTSEESFTLPKPTKSGYEFKGWTGSNGTTPKKTVKITAGTTGDLYYVANWGLPTYYVEVNAIVQNEEYDYKSGFEFSVWVNGVLDAEHVSDWYDFNCEYGTEIKVKVHPTAGYSIYSFTTKTFTITSDYVIYGEWYDDIPPTITKFVVDNYGLYNPNIGLDAGWNIGLTVDGYDEGTGIQKFQTWLVPYGNGSGIGRADGSYRYIDNVLYMEEPGGRRLCAYAIDWAGNETEYCENVQFYI